MSKERPILFNGAMVRAILASQKTQTRRAIKNVPSWDHFGKDIMDWRLSGIHQEGYGEHDQLEGTDQWYLDVQTDVDDHSRKVILCPFGKPGDRLWVRESFWGCDLPGYGDQPCVVYDDEWIGKEYHPAAARPWARKFGRIPAIHMPREACRLVLEITEVRVERLQEISEADALAEGFELTGWQPTYSNPDNSMGDETFTARDNFAETWNQLYQNWTVNPWVWVIEFKVVTP